MGIVAIIVVGFIAGLLARAIMPGNDAMGWVATTLLGIVGSFVGGFIASLVNHDDANIATFHPTGIIMSVIGALVVLSIYHLATRRRRLV